MTTFKSRRSGEDLRDDPAVRAYAEALEKAAQHIADNLGRNEPGGTIYPDGTDRSSHRS